MMQAVGADPAQSHHDHFDNVYQSVVEAIARGTLPERIYEGSSGSYFVRDTTGRTVGVFKPKNEEPYGSLNPKWAKWLHRHCCPCCFGRSCLLPNQGYLSEAGASVVDRMLGLDVVPKTKVVHLTSPSFNYSTIDKASAKSRQIASETLPQGLAKNVVTGLPAKIGSLQMFVNNYKDSYKMLALLNEHPLPEKAARDFQFKFEKMVVLDFIIRNTDRGYDNWLVKIEGGHYCELAHPDQDSVGSTQKEVTVAIAAIDNGLAFPFKHPDSWRAYPFQWAWLPHAKQPFSQQTIDLVLLKLSSTQFMNSLITELHQLFSIDKSFSEPMFERQMEVLRGQVFNLVQAMREGRAPVDLVQMPPMYIRVRGDTSPGMFTQHFPGRGPFFTRC